MATSDRSDIELTAGNKDRIAVEPWHGRVSIFVIDGSGSVEGESHVVMEPAECDALIAAIGRALGRPASTSPRYAPSDELRFIEPICAALALQCATQEEALDAITKAMQDYRAKAVKLALEQTRPMSMVLDGARHTPISTPLEERIAKAIQANIYERDAPTTEREEAVHLDGYAKGLREALAMVREQGPTVPRAAVAAALAPVLTLHAQVAETNEGEYRDGLIEALLTALDEARATLAAAGLWPVPAHTKEQP